MQFPWQSRCQGSSSLRSDSPLQFICSLGDRKGPPQLAASLPRGRLKRAADRFEPACLVGEVAEVILHKADQPNLLADLLDADALAGEDRAEIDFLPIKADAPACGHGDGPVVEWVIKFQQASVGTR